MRYLMHRGGAWFAVALALSAAGWAGSAAQACPTCGAAWRRAPCGRDEIPVLNAAGFAGLRHILELDPTFVKLDISKIKNVVLAIGPKPGGDVGTGPVLMIATGQLVETELASGRVTSRVETITPTEEALD